MKKRFFFEPIIVYVAGFLILHVGCYITFALLIWFSVKEVLTSNNIVDTIGYMLGVVGCTAFLIDVIWLNTTMSNSRIDYLVVTEDYAEWHGLFRRKKRLYYRDCQFIDIETFNKEARCPVIRGDECAMIYLSTEPYPEEMSGRINHVFCSDTFIKFRYTDKLAEALLEVVPEEQARMLLAFYRQMKNFDAETERLRKARKAKARQKARARKKRR